MRARMQGVIVAATLLALPYAVQAQTLVAPVAPAGPTMAAATAGFHPSVAPDDQVSRQRAADDAAQSGRGPYEALMVVGGVVVITGLIIGGAGGTVLAIAGAVVALYGLYMYLR